MKPVKNLAASVHQRLLDKARQTGRPFNELLQYFAIERFLYRLSQSKYAKNFVLKGALMLNVWEGSSLPRATLDIDVLGQQISNEIEGVNRAIQGICEQAVEADGLTFDPASARGVRIAEDTGYQGVRVRFNGSLGNARLSMPLTSDFAGGTDHAVQWRAFRNRNRLESAPESFSEVMTGVTDFLRPVASAIAENRPFRGVWNPPGRWWTGN